MEFVIEKKENVGILFRALWNKYLVKLKAFFTLESSVSKSKEPTDILKI